MITKAGDRNGSINMNYNLRNITIRQKDIVRKLKGREGILKARKWRMKSSRGRTMILDWR